jgi:hypothetical protein
MTVTVVDAGPRQVSRCVEVAAPAGELFAIVADPRRHGEIDGSGTVRENASAPAELVAGARFSTKMRMYGLPYRITSTVTALKLLMPAMPALVRDENWVGQPGSTSLRIGVTSPS